MPDPPTDNERIILAKLQETVRMDGEHTRSDIAEIKELVREQSRMYQALDVRTAVAESTLRAHGGEIEKLRSRDRANSWLAAIGSALATVGTALASWALSK